MAENKKNCEINFICRLCSCILKNPQQTTCCGSHFCKNCIEAKCSVGENTCPECSTTNVTYYPDRYFERLLHGHISSTGTECPKASCHVAKHWKQGNDSAPFSDISTNTPSDSVIDKGETLTGYAEREKPPGMRSLKSRECTTERNSNPGESAVVECGKMSTVSHISLPCVVTMYKDLKEIGHSGCSSKEQSNAKNALEAQDNSLLVANTHLSSKVSKLSEQVSERQNRVEKMLDEQQKLIQTLSSKVQLLENRVCSHALLPYSVVIPNIESYIEGSIGDEWISPDFYTGTFSNKGYRLQLSIVPNSLHMRKKDKALSARLLITKGENDGKLNWPFYARFTLVFIDPSGREKPYEVKGRHTWESPSDESSMQFIACITHKDLVKYIQHDDSIHVCISDN